jgi:hypothetical protein
LIALAFEGAPPAEIVGQVLGGDAVEAGEPLLEAAVVGVDVIDVEVRRRFAIGWLGSIALFVSPDSIACTRTT